MDTCPDLPQLHNGRNIKVNRLIKEYDRKEMKIALFFSDEIASDCTVRQLQEKNQRIKNKLHLLIFIPLVSVCS